MKKTPPATPDAPFIRPARRDDCATIRNIARVAYSLYLSRMDREPAPMNEDYEARAEEGSLYVLETAEGILGFIVLLPEENSLLLDNLAVSPAAQGRGYGRVLLAFAEEQAQKAGFKEITLYTNEVMTENLKLYARMGYSETGRAVCNGYRRVFFSKKPAQSNQKPFLFLDNS